MIPNSPSAKNAGFTLLLAITPLFGNGGVGDQETKAVKIVIYPFGAHLLPIHIKTDLL